MSPWGGKRSGKRSDAKKVGAPVGNVNRRAAKWLPKATDTAERRTFLDALEDAETIPNSEKAATLTHLMFARCVTTAESVGATRLVKVLLALDRHRLTNLRVDGFELAARREALKDDALTKIWKVVCDCQDCGDKSDGVLQALHLALLQMGGTDEIRMGGAHAQEQDRNSASQ